MAELKICGITDPAFAVEAARLGVAYLGLIFAEASARRVTPERAAEIVRAVRREAKTPRFVGVFTRIDTDMIIRLAHETGFGIAQLHYAADAESVRTLKDAGLEVWTLVKTLSETPAEADAALLDGRIGAQSAAADWTMVSPLKAAGRRVVLAGGISARNIDDAAKTGADVIDVNSALETSPGVKSIDLLRNLVRHFNGATSCA